RNLQEISLVELSGANGLCLECKTSLRRCLKESARFCLSQEKQASARPPLSTRSHKALPPVGIFGSVGDNVSNSMEPVKPICRCSKRSDNCAGISLRLSMCCAPTRPFGCCRCLLC